MSHGPFRSFLPPAGTAVWCDAHVMPGAAKSKLGNLRQGLPGCCATILVAGARFELATFRLSGSLKTGNSQEKTTE